VGPAVRQGLASTLSRRLMIVELVGKPKTERATGIVAFGDCASCTAPRAAVANDPVASGRTNFYASSMSVFARLVLEVSGTCDRKAMRALLHWGAGVTASEVCLNFVEASEVHPAALQLLAAVIRRLGLGRGLRIRGLPVRDAGILNELGIPAGVLEGVRPTPCPDQTDILIDSEGCRSHFGLRTGAHGRRNT
jgi:hypothetical protein